MADVKRKKTLEVPMTFGDNIRYVKGVSKYTTCGDVIKMVLKKLDDGKENGDPEAYGIYESSRGIERLLPSKSKMLKVMRTWGMGNNYEFVFRKVNTRFTLPKLSDAKRRKLTHRRRDLHAVATGSSTNRTYTCAPACENAKFSRPGRFVNELYCNEDSDSSMEEFMSTVDQANMAAVLNFCGSVAASHVKKLSSDGSTCELSRNVTGQSTDGSLVYNQSVTSANDLNNVKFAIKKSLKSKTFTMSKPEESVSEDINENTSSIPAQPREKLGSRGKHVKEAIRTVKRHEKLASHIVTRVSKMNQREGKEALLQKYFADYITYRSPGQEYKYQDSRFRERGDGAEASMVTDTSRQQGVGSEYTVQCTPRRKSDRPLTLPTTLFMDEEEGSEGDSGHHEGAVNFDTAFIDDTPEEPHTVHNNTINSASTGRLVDYSLSEEDSLLTDPSDISTCSDHVHNVSTVSNILKCAFNENTRSSSEDEAMESFMKTVLYDPDDMSDEGLSSLGSDVENEIIV